MAAGLVYTTDDKPGIRRIGKGTRARFVGPRNTPVGSKAELARIRTHGSMMKTVAQRTSRTAKEVGKMTAARSRGPWSAAAQAGLAAV